MKLAEMIRAGWFKVTGLAFDAHSYIQTKALLKGHEEAAKGIQGGYNLLAIMSTHERLIRKLVLKMDCPLDATSARGVTAADAKQDQMILAEERDNFFYNERPIVKPDTGSKWADDLLRKLNS